MKLPITVTTDVTQEELSVFVKQSIIKQFKYLKYAKYFLYFVILLMLLNTYNMAQAGAHWSNFLRMGVFIVVLFLLWQFMPKIQAKNIYQQKKADFDHSTYLFSENSMSIKSATIAAELNWNAFKKVEKDENFLWLFVAQNQSYILPLRCFENKEILDAVYQLAKGKIK